MTRKVGFAAGLGKLGEIGGKVAPAPSPIARPAEAIEAGEGDGPVRAAPGPRRNGKVNIAGYFDPAVRKQLAMLAVEHDTDQVKLMAEALNLLFEKYGRSPIASA
ncbi:ribbon-helix-helix domain-containing protein [Sphingomonas lacusdianchii]|uniref:ribbon-helix-helix domain-containing protein n=1 Tax=Sphingomonas lacusdianchii TaxID=2917992 RepID=UPI001F5A3C4C|nr:ribbon-helix-helix domain-containing protein [Sphingomonas sp. JXJ CY 53]